MKKHLRAVVIFVFATLLMSVSFLQASTFAIASNHSQIVTSFAAPIETTFFGEVEEDGTGCSVYMILNVILDILMASVGIVGVIGISIAGIQYLTSKGNEQQATKAKLRIREIVIGIVLFAVLYSVLNFILPGAKFNQNTACAPASQSNSTDGQQQSSQSQNSQSQNSQQQGSQSQNSQQQNNNNANAAQEEPIVLSSQIAKKYSPTKMAKLIAEGELAPSPVCTDCSWSERIAQTAELLSWPKGTPKSVYNWTYSRKTIKKFRKWSDLTKAKPNQAFQKALDALWPKHKFTSMTVLGADCGLFVGVVVRYSGLDRTSNTNCPTANRDYSNSKNWKRVKKARRGDVCVRDGCHTRIYLGDGLIAEANHNGRNFGHIIKDNNGCAGYTIWRAK